MSAIQARLHGGVETYRQSSTTTQLAIAVGVVGLAVSGIVHLALAGGEFSEVPWLGVGFVVAGIVSLVAAVGGAVGDRRAWVVGAGIAVLSLLTWAVSRSVGLPGATEDVGNWAEPVATVAKVAEAAVVAAAATVLRPRDV